MSLFPNVAFLRGVLRPRDFPPEDFPEIAFVGRSNVGKSSLINVVLGRRKIAHTSKKPGKTAQINFFQIDQRFVLVDMPGYGYAVASHKMQNLWGTLIPGYFEKRRCLMHTFVLLDSRHPPKEKDLQTIQFLRSVQKPITLILTKSDKSSAETLALHTQQLRNFLGETPDQPYTLILPFSTYRAELIEDVRQTILDSIALC